MPILCAKIVISQFTTPFVASLICAASIACLRADTVRAVEPRSTRAGYEAAANEYDVVGKVVREWNEKRQRNEFVIHDHEDDVRYVILSSQVVERGDLVGRRVGLNGRTRLRVDREEGLIHPDEVEFLDSDVRLAQFVASDDAVPPNLSPSEALSSDINIFMPGSAPPVTNGPPPAWIETDRSQALGVGSIWGRAEYLYWYTPGMNTPALVTTSPMGTPQDEAGVLGQAGTETLFGGGKLLEDTRHGGRVQAGLWFGPGFGIEGEYLGLREEAASFAATSDGSTILAVPFFNVNPRDSMNPALFAPAREDSFLVGFTDPAGNPLTSGNVSVSSRNKFRSAGLRALIKQCGHSQGLNCPEDRRVDLLLGYRYMHLDDTLGLNANVTTLDGTNQVFNITDSFATENVFNGIETGAQLQGGWQRVSYELLAKIALGTVRQQATIVGNTDITAGGMTTSNTGGLFAQSSNIGSFSRDEFGVVPELGATIGIALTPRLRATLGYSFIYWSNVLRAAEQIDRNINGDFLPPPAMPFTGPARPQYVFRETDFWAQGFRVGVDFRW